MSNTPRIVDLFAGPRGWDTGLAYAGITEGVLGVEYEPNAHATALAAGHHGILADVSALDPLEVCGPDLEGLIASPPCPGFSAAGKGLGRKDFGVLLAAIDDLGSGRSPRAVLEDVRARQHDERSALTLEPLRWILDTEPEWIALEQVPAVLPLWRAYAPVLAAEGYNVWTDTITSEQYGVPQTRKRAVLLAHRSRPVGRPVPTHSKYHNRTPDKLDPGVEKWVSMAEAFGWADQEGHLRSNYSHGGDLATRGERPFDHPAFTVTSHVDRNLFVFTGQNSRQSGGTTKPFARSVDAPAPTAYWTPTHMGDVYNSKGCVRPIDEPAPTMTASMDNGNFRWTKGEPGADGRNHKAEGSVRVSVEEAAILQSFPAVYPWKGTKGSQYQQVGNAVPPLVSAHVMRALGVQPSAAASTEGVA